LTGIDVTNYQTLLSNIHFADLQVIRYQISGLYLLACVWIMINL